MNARPLKTYQGVGIERIDAMLTEQPTSPILGVGPCGCGKSRIMYELAQRWMHRGKRVGIMTHRQMLTDQLVGMLTDSLTPHTAFAAEYKYDAKQPIQIMSAPTVFARCFRQAKVELPDLDLILVDEAHQQTGKSAQAILYGAFQDGHVVNGYTFRGASVVGFTATPVMPTPIYQRLVEFGTYSEMRREGMHSIVKVISPDKIDLRAIDKLGNDRAKVGGYSEGQLERVIKDNAPIFGSVIQSYREINPQQWPMILFAPSVPTSKWFASSFCDDGVPVAHLDGEMIGMPDMQRSIGNRLHYIPSTPENRRSLLEQHRDGEIKGVCNRFVLREAIDMPWCYHAIFATVMSGLSTYLQSVGRLQRYWPDYDHKIMQCHGGHYWKHGSPNEDREWSMADTDGSLARVRAGKLQKGEKPEGVRCGKCGMWRLRGPICPGCHHVQHQSIRAVRQVSGKLKYQMGVFTRGPHGLQRAPYSDFGPARCLGRLSEIGWSQQPWRSSWRVLARRGLVLTGMRFETRRQGLMIVGGIKA